MHMLLRALLLAAFVAAVPLSARADEKTQTRQKDVKVTVVTDKDDGGKVTVNKGTTLVVKLEGQAGTGFTWVVAKNDEKILKPVGKPAIERADKRVGGKELVVHKFTAAEEGEVKLELAYKRTFEKDKPPAKKFSVTVTVK